MMVKQLVAGTNLCRTEVNFSMYFQWSPDKLYVLYSKYSTV